VANTQSREVNLTKRIQTPRGMRYCAVVLGSNGRIRPDVVLVNGLPEQTLVRYEIRTEFGMSST